MISYLRGEPLPMASLHKLPKIWKSIGKTGLSTENSANSCPIEIYPYELSIILTNFLARVWNGAYGLGNQVQVQSLSDALAAISKAHEMVRKQISIYQNKGEYILPVKRLIEGF